MKGAQYLLVFVTSYVRELQFYPDTLDDGVQNIFYDYDVKEILLYGNQEAYCRDLELTESIWKMKPDVDGPENFSEPPTAAMVHDTFACAPEKKPVHVLSSGSLATREQVFCTKETKDRSQL